MDLFAVPTISFRLLYGFLILQHARRELLWLSVIAHPTAEWIARQFAEAFGWRAAPHYVVRDRDRVTAASSSGAFAPRVSAAPHRHTGGAGGCRLRQSSIASRPSRARMHDQSS